jgi:hypothetical protein
VGENKGDIFNHQQRLESALEVSRVVARMGGDDNRAHQRRRQGG